MYEYDILVSVKFFSKENGGRENLPPVKDKEYTYRPTFRLENDTFGYCFGIVIGNYIENYKFDTDLLNVKVLFLRFSEIVPAPTNANTTSLPSFVFVPGFIFSMTLKMFSKS